MMTPPTIYVVVPGDNDLQSTFIRAHLERLPARTVGVHGYIPSIAGKRLLSDAVLPAAGRKIARFFRRQPWDEEITRGYVRAFSARPAAILAEYGTTGVRVMDACRRARLPLIVHFHGFDASVHAVLDEHRNAYRRLFDVAAAIVAVSPAMRARLIGLGASPDKVHYNPCGVDCRDFAMMDASLAPPVIVAAGRLVDKKAPHLTILAFAEVLRHRPDARLRVIGDGPLMSVCRDIVAAFGLHDTVALLGHQPHQVIRDEMRRARCFVQHSVTAQNGDAEGTPVAVLEAGASGLPSVSTRHAGIPDVIVDGETGFLVDEFDTQGMSRRIRRLLDDPALAARMGAAARSRIEARFSLDDRIATLWQIVSGALNDGPRRNEAGLSLAVQPEGR